MKEHVIRLCALQADVGREKVHQTFSSRETETQRCKITASCLVRKLRIPRLTGMLDVESRRLYRQMFFVFEPRIYKSLKIWTGLKKRLLRDKLAAANFGVILSPHNVREMRYISSPDLEWTHMDGPLACLCQQFVQYFMSWGFMDSHQMW